MRRKLGLHTKTPPFSSGNLIEVGTLYLCAVPLSILSSYPSIMDMELGKFILQAAISVGGAFLAAYLATKKFRSEKWWEKKAAAYAELVEALHKMKWPASEHLNAEIEYRKVSDDDSNRMWKEFGVARQNIWRLADTSSFLISGEVMKAVQEMEQDLGKARSAESWFEHLDEQYGAVDKCLMRIKEIGKTDLGL